MADTVRTHAALIALLSDGAPAHSTNRQLLRDWLASTPSFFGVTSVQEARFGAVGDGSVDDTNAINAAINALPAAGGVVLFPPGKFRFTADISTAINSKDLVVLKGCNDRTYIGNTGHTPVATTFYCKELTTYLYTKSGTGNRVLILDGIFFDGGNGGGAAQASTTCPGIVYSADLLQNYFTVRRCMATYFAYAHTNTTAQRALFDLRPVWGRVEENYFGQATNGRHLYIGSGTQTKVRDTEFTTARECYYVSSSQNVVFDNCVFESCTTVGAQYRSQVKHLDCWYENVGFNSGTAFTSGIAERNHGLAMPAGALQAAGGIITPIQQLYGDLRILRANFQSMASGGSAYVAPAWIEAVGQATGTSTGGTLTLSGKKPGGTKLFYDTTMAMTATERGSAFHVFIPEDGWSTDAGTTGGGLFAGTGNKDYRRVNSGVGRIWMNDGSTTYLMTIKGGRLILDAQSYTSALGAAPGATIYPIGDQWEIGDKIVFPVPVAGGNTGLVCTTAGTASPTWKTYGAIQA